MAKQNETKNKRLFIERTFLDVSDGDACVLEQDKNLTETAFEDIGLLYRNLVQFYGRCVSKVFIDTMTKETIQVGWVFRKRVNAEDREDPKRTFLQETWVSVFSGLPEIKKHYFDFDSGFELKKKRV